MPAEDYSHFRSAGELRAGVLMWQIFPPFLIAFGTVGNILSIVVLLKSRFRKIASSTYFIGLAAADLSILYVGLLRQWVKYAFGADVRFASSASCKIHWWLIYSNADVCVWILPAITVERLVSTLCPTRSKAICSAQTAKIVLGAIVTTALLLNSHLLYGFGRLEIVADNVTVVLPCVPLTDSYDRFFTKIWTWIDLCKFSLIPFAILALGNVCIIWKVLRSAKKTRTQVGPAQGLHSSASADKTTAMSKLLVSLNFVFILCTAPVCVYFIGSPYWVPGDVPMNIQLQDPLWAVVNLMMYTNNVVNFVLYCLSGSRFRGELKKLFAFRRTGAGRGEMTTRPPSSRTNITSRDPILIGPSVSAISGSMENPVTGISRIQTSNGGPAMSVISGGTYNTAAAMYRTQTSNGSTVSAISEGTNKMLVPSDIADTVSNTTIVSRTQTSNGQIVSAISEGTNNTTTGISRTQTSNGTAVTAISEGTSKMLVPSDIADTVSNTTGVSRTQTSNGQTVSAISEGTKLVPSDIADTVSNTTGISHAHTSKCLTASTISDCTDDDKATTNYNVQAFKDSGVSALPEGTETTMPTNHSGIQGFTGPAESAISGYNDKTTANDSGYHPLNTPDVSTISGGTNNHDTF